VMRPNGQDDVRLELLDTQLMCSASGPADDVMSIHNAARSCMEVDEEHRLFEPIS
jgi:hypothetical protein